MSFLDKAKKLAEQAAEKAGPLIDKAAPHAQNAVDKAGQQIDRRTGGKYHDKLEAVEAKVSELAEKRMAERRGAAAGAGPDTGFPAQPGAADGFPAQPGTASGFPAQPGTADGFPAQPGRAPDLDDTFSSRTGSPDVFRADDAPAQPDLHGGQPDDPAHSGAATGTDYSTATLGDRGSEPVFSAETPEVSFPAQPPATTFPAEPDSRAGQPDDPEHSLGSGSTEFPGLSEGPVGTPEATEEDRPDAGPAMNGPGTPRS